MQAGASPTLFIAPVLFKTVNPQTHSEQVLWKMRQSILCLKLYDLIAHQFSEYCRIRGQPFSGDWKAAPAKLVQDFSIVCRDIIPRHLLPAEIVEFFGPKEVEAEMRRKERRDLKKWGNIRPPQDPARGSLGLRRTPGQPAGHFRRARRARVRALRREAARAELRRRRAEPQPSRFSLARACGLSRSPGRLALPPGAGRTRSPRQARAARPALRGEQQAHPGDGVREAAAEKGRQRNQGRRVQARRGGHPPARPREESAAGKPGGAHDEPQELSGQGYGCRNQDEVREILEIMAEKHPYFARIYDVDLPGARGGQKTRYLALLDCRDPKQGKQPG